MIFKFVFLLKKSFDGVAGALARVAYLLALHPEEQQKSYNEVNDAMVDGKMSYEALNGLEYLDMVITGNTCAAQIIILRVIIMIDCRVCANVPGKRKIGEEMHAGLSTSGDRFHDSERCDCGDSS